MGDVLVHKLAIHVHNGNNGYNWNDNLLMEQFTCIVNSPSLYFPEGKKVVDGRCISVQIGYIYTCT